MAAFSTILDAVARRLGSLLCVGLDPHPGDLAAPTAAAARDFCLRLVRETDGLAAAYKPNAAFFEALGPEGWAALREVIAAVPAGIPVILDAKRGDIASTAQAYARSAFEQLGATAVTVSPYLGRDSLAPFLADPALGAFILCKTSNPGAADLQDLILAGAVPRDRSGAPSADADASAPPGAHGAGKARHGWEAGLRLYEKVALLAQEWNTAGNVGLVVGASYPEALSAVRRLAPDLWILAPGVGAQGGDMRAALRAGLRDDGLGLLLPVSRAIARADSPRAEAEALLEMIRRQQKSTVARPPDRSRSRVPEALARGLLAAGCVRFGQFTLKSGRQSPIYLDLRRLISHPALLAQVADAYLPLLQRLAFDRVAALPYAALPIATAICLRGGWPMIYPRREAKAYGTGVEIEGVFTAGEQAVVIDDLATTGESKFEAIAKLTSAGLAVADIVVLIDRCSGATEALEAAGYRLHAVTNLPDLLDYWEQAALVSPEHIAAARDFLKEQP